MRDLRKYARSTNMQLVWGGLFLIFVIGLGLIYVFYDLSGLVTGLICMLAGLSPVVLIAAALWLLDRIARMNDRD